MGPKRLQPLLVVDRNSAEVVGLGGIRPTDSPSIGEIGYVFRPAFWGKGIATECVKAWVKWGFKELQLTSITADGVKNPASIRVLEKSGFLVVKEHANMKDLSLEREHYLL